jgi:hypothetical protein
MGVDACPGMIPWNVSCTGVRSDKLRPISMKIFLIMRFNEAPLSINVLATLCRLIGTFWSKCDVILGRDPQIADRLYITVLYMSFYRF